VKYRVDAATLPPGIRVLAYQFAGARTFSIDASYQVGAVDDPPGKEGLTALVTRLVGRRAGRADGGPSFAGRLFVAGLAYDAAGGMDAVDFWTRGPPERLATALAVEADRLRDPLAGVEKEDFFRERDGMVRELLDARDPIARETEIQWLLEAALPPGPYRRALAGSPETLRSIAFEDVRAFCREHLTPDRLLLVVLGPEPASDMARRVRTAFGPFRQGASVRPPRARASQALDFATAPAPLTRRGPVNGAHLWLGWTLPADSSGDGESLGPAAAVARTLVAEAMGDVPGDVSVQVRREDGYALVAVGVGLFEEGDAEKVLAALSKATMPPEATWIAADALQMVHGYLALERPDAERVARFARSTGGGDVFRIMQPRIEPNRSLHERLERWLQPSRAVALMVFPEHGRMEPSVGATASGEVLWSSEPLGEPRLPPGTYDVLALARPPGLDVAFREQLPNGVRLVILFRSGFPLVQVRLVVKTHPEGTPEVPAGLPGLALAVAQRASTSAEAQRCDSRGAGFDGNQVIISGAAPRSLLVGRLQRIACWTERLSVDGQSLDRRRRAASRQLQASSAKPGGAAVRALIDRLYPGTSADLARDRLETQASATADRLERWLASELRPERATLIIAGDVVAGPQLMDTIRKLFGAWQPARRAPTTPAKPPPPPVAGPILFAPWPGARSASLLAAARLPPRAARDDPAFDAMLRELTRQLARDRGDASLGQTIVQQASMPYGVLLLAGASVPAGRAAPALRHLLEAFDGMAFAPPSRDLTDILRWDVAREYSFRFETTGQVADGLASIAVRDESPDFWENLPASIASLTPERILAEARPLAGRAAVVAGDRDAIVPQLRKAGFTVEVLPEPRLLPK